MADRNYVWVELTNTGPGPLSINTRDGQKGVNPRQTITVEMDSAELDGLEVYHKSGQLRVEPGEAPSDDTVVVTAKTIQQPDPDTPPTGQIDAEASGLNHPDAQAQATSAALNDVGVEDPNDQGTGAGGEAPVVDDDDDVKAERVTHRGGGRYYGMAGDEAVTESMTKAEAEKYAADNGIPLE